MSTPNKQYKVFNIAETNPTGAPDAGFLWIYPREGKLWIRNSEGTEYPLAGVSVAGAGPIPVWLPTIPEIYVGDYYLYEDLLYRATAESNSSDPKQPDTFVGTFWELVDLSDLAHVQNTDFKLGVHPLLIELNGPLIDFTSGAFATLFQNKNFFGIDPTTPESQKPYSIKTGNNNQEFYVTYLGATGSIKFESDENQIIGDTPIVLENGDWVKFKGGFGSPFVAGKTRFISSNLRAELLSIDQVSTDVTPDINETGTLSTVASGITSATISGGPYTVDELAGKYLIVTHDDVTGISRTPITAHLISANTTDGIVTFSPAIQYAGDPTYQVVTPYAATIEDQDNIIAANASDNIVITVPAITATDNRISLTIYREGGNDLDSEHIVFIAMQNNVLGTPTVTLINDYELIELRAHTSGIFHWDFLGSNRLCVSLNVSITTPNVTPLSNTTDETIKGTAWELNHPSRWIAEVQSDDSVELIYNSRIKRNLLVTAVVEVVRDSLSPEVTISAQLDTGAGWTLIDSQEIPLTNASDKAGRTFIISQCFEFGDKVRFVSKTDTGTYHIKDLRIKMAYPNG